MAVLKIHVIRATGETKPIKRPHQVYNEPGKKQRAKVFTVLRIKDTLTLRFHLRDTIKPYQQMMETKQHEKKTDKVLGYHYIQSFKPGESHAGEAHQVGCRIYRAMLRRRF